MSNQARHLRTSSYPTQTCSDHSPHDGSPSSSPEPEEPLPPIPPTIRAVKNSNNAAQGRTLVICLDGTGDKFDNDNSNVVNFVACLKKDDPNQITYYQSGIGTYDGSGLTSGISAAVDMAVGSGLGIHIKDAYRFLMQNYIEGDRICLLGFSRGSYTVRCLAGMLHKVGLLPAHNSAQVSFAYNFYKNDTPEGWKMSAGFKKTFCNNVEVYFVGIWDCVASVGFIPRKLPFSKSPTNTIQYFRHAMAMDEHRAKFKVLQYQHQNPAANSRSLTFDNTPKAKVKTETNNIGKLLSSCFGRKEIIEAAEKDHVNGSMNGTAEKDPSGPVSKLKRTTTLQSVAKQLIKKKKEDDEQTKHEKEFEKDDHSVHRHIQTDVLEVWFAGGHADVGGGAVQNHERHVLSRIPLRWMLRQCFECNTGILFNTAALAETGIDIPTVWPMYKTPKRPVCGPSPDMVAQYQAKALPPLKRRSTALGIERNPSVKSEKTLNPHSIKQADHFPLGDLYDEKRHAVADLDLLPEQVEDHFDAMAPINDMLEIAKTWWILEFWPIKLRVQKQVKHSDIDEERWEKVIGVNRGRFRAIRELEPNMHWTVQFRRDEAGYAIRNRIDRDAIWKIAT